MEKWKVLMGRQELTQERVQLLTMKVLSDLVGDLHLTDLTLKAFYALLLLLCVLYCEQAVVIISWIFQHHTEVLADIANTQSLGFYSIPVFIFQVVDNNSVEKAGNQKNKEWVVTGAADVREFEELLREILTTSSS
jgi:hypothetical protein